MSRPKTVSLQTIIRWGNGWNPPAKVVHIDAQGRRHFIVTRLAACVSVARSCVAKGYKTEFTYKQNGHEYTVTGWEETSK